MYLLILIPIIVGAATQALKLLIDGIPHNFNWHHLISDYGGMPSSHTAFVSSLVAVVGLREGLDSAAFAVSLILMLVVVRDAVGFRREIGRNAKLTNFIARRTLNKKQGLLTERVGHTIPEVLAGFAFGAALSVALYVFWGAI